LESATDSLPEIEEWSEDELLASEYATLGFYLSGHPLAKHVGRLRELSVTELAALEGKSNNADLVVAGIIVSLRPMRSKRGGRWAILNLQDMTGTVEVLVFPEAFGRLENVLHTNTALLIRGRVAIEDVGTRVILSDARLLEEVTSPAPSRLRVRMDLAAFDESVLDRLEELFDRKPGPCPVSFELLRPDGEVAELQTERSVRPDRDLLLEIQEICGADAVEVLR
jgi:DNA polymerase-3 subunit alpha